MTEITILFIRKAQAKRFPSEQLRNRRPVRECDRSSLRVGDVRVGVDAEVLINRREDIVRVERAFAWSAADVISRADDLTCANAAASDEHRHCSRPVIATDGSITVF